MNRLSLLFSLILLIVIASHVEGRGGGRGGGGRSSGGGSSGGRSSGGSSGGRSSGGSSGGRSSGMSSRGSSGGRSGGSSGGRSGGSSGGRSGGSSGGRSSGVSSGGSSGGRSTEGGSSGGRSTEGGSSGSSSRRSRGGNGGRGGGGRGGMSSSRSTYSSMSRSRYNRGVRKTTVKKSPHRFKPSKKKMMKKALLVGVAAYTGHKLTKVSNKFKKHSFRRGHSSMTSSWHSRDWRRAVSIDNEFLCRSNPDCTWLDDDLECDEIRLDFEPSNIWFGGDSTSIRGKCQCQDMFWWDDNELQCQMFWEGAEDDFVKEDDESFGMPWWLDLILAIVAVVVMYVCYFLCCSPPKKQGGTLSN